MFSLVIGFVMTSGESGQTCRQIRGPEQAVEAPV